MNILVNFYNSKIGGGKNILDNFTNEILSSNSLNHNWIILVPSKNYYLENRKNVKFITIESIANNNIFFPLLYLYSLPKIIKSYKIDLVVNFGDVIIPTRIKQIYFFDWAYAVYDEPYIWERMSLKDKIVRKTKIFIIDRYIKNVQLIICQTSNMARRLHKKYGVEQIKVIPTPFGMTLSEKVNKNFSFSKGKKYFLYPASYATHKNFSIIYKLAELIKSKNLPFVIILTIDEKTASDFLCKVNLNQLTSIVNVGKLNGEEISQIYKSCDVLLFPSLLESYGLPYIESMVFEKPILTSDLDFAHAICGNAAFYFNPFDPESILEVMQNFQADPEVLINKIQNGKKIVQNLPNWKDVFLQFQEQIEILLK